MDRIRRVMAEVAHRETRSDALRRVWRRTTSRLRARVGRPVSTDAATRGGADGSTPPANARPDAWYVGEWSRLVTAVLGTESDAVPSADPAVPAQAVSRARQLRAQAGLAEAIARGEGLEGAVCGSVTGLAETGEWTDWNAAWSMTEGVGRLASGATASALGRVVLLHRRRQFDRAWKLARDLDDETLATHIPVEAVDAALATATDEARARALGIGSWVERMTAEVLVDLASRFLAFGERERATDLLRELGGRGPTNLDEHRLLSRALTERRLASRATPVPVGSIPFAVMTCRAPGGAPATGNVGHDIQALSVLGNLARLGSLSFTGDDGLGDLAAELQQRVRPELRTSAVAGTVHLLTVDRDFTSVSDVPEGTWMLAVGSHMQPLHDLRYDFPYHPNIRPLFISFHVSRLEMLSDEALDYLRRFGPVGCRDWNTVFLLLAAGVEAFFTGCVTTTVDGLFPPRAAADGGKGAVGLIDVPRRYAAGARDVRVYSHESPADRGLPASNSLHAALEILAAYQRDLDRGVTSRLLAYLPLTSLGVPVDFRPGKPGDIRFAGLVGLRPASAELEAMRGGIRDLIAAILEPILGGEPEAVVYARWREVTRERVADARARSEAPLADTPTAIDVDAAVRTSREGSRRFGPHDAVDRATVTDVVVAFDQNLTYPAAVLLELVVTNASGPLRLWVLGRGLTDAYQGWLAAAFPAIPMTFLPCDRISYEVAGPRRRIPRRITVSTMDRLLLPVMLEDVRRVVYVDVDTLMLGDVCRLAATDLGRPAGRCPRLERERGERVAAGGTAT